jgi:Zn-dependent protease
MTQPPYLPPYQQPYPPAPRLLCPQCGTELSLALLACPRCQRLVHADRLNWLAAEAKAAAERNDAATSLARWREMLPLLPRESRQFATVAARVEALEREQDAASPGPPGARRTSASGGKVTGITSLLVFLFAGLTKAKTFWTMLAFASVYWTVYGWKLAVGLTLSIYVHEMGHIALLLRHGVRASAPMFIPGLGAMIMLKQHPTGPKVDARIGLAGPIWGLGAALVCYVGYLLLHWPSLAATAQLGAWINLFNLTPVWQLDGSRGFRSLSIAQRWTVLGIVASTYGAICYLMQNWKGPHGMLLLVGAVALLRCVSQSKSENPEGDRVGLAQYVVLVLALSALSMLHVPGVTDR